MGPRPQRVNNVFWLNNVYHQFKSLQFFVLASNDSYAIKWVYFSSERVIEYCQHETFCPTIGGNHYFHSGTIAGS